MQNKHVRYQVDGCPCFCGSLHGVEGQGIELQATCIDIAVVAGLRFGVRCQNLLMVICQLQARVATISLSLEGLQLLASLGRVHIANVLLPSPEC